MGNTSRTCDPRNLITDPIKYVRCSVCGREEVRPIASKLPAGAIFIENSSTLEICLNCGRVISSFKLGWAVRDWLTSSGTRVDMTLKEFLVHAGAVGL